MLSQINFHIKNHYLNALLLDLPWGLSYETVYGTESPQNPGGVSQRLKKALTKIQEAQRLASISALHPSLTRTYSKQYSSLNLTWILRQFSGVLYSFAFIFVVARNFVRFFALQIDSGWKKARNMASSQAAEDLSKTKASPSLPR